MLIALDGLVNKYRMKLSGVIHAGAHHAEEAKAYRQLGVKDVIWIEGNPDLKPTLERILNRFPGQVLEMGLLSETDGKEVTFNITNFDSMSSSILEFGTHTTVSPDTVFVDHKVLPTITMDTLLADYDLTQYNFLNLDLQGAELLALKGATKVLANIDYIYSEINVDYLYKDCVLLDELEAFLDEFELMEAHLEGSADRDHPRWSGWGDGLWIRRNKIGRRR